MKKIIIVTVIVFIVLIGIVISAPLLFKSSLLEATKTTINKQFNAKVEFADLHVSLFKRFPNVTLDLNDVNIVGKGEFVSDTLMQVSHVGTKMNLSSLFKREDRSIDEIILESPEIRLLVNEAGKANWDLIAGSNEPAPKAVNGKEDVENENAFELQLENIVLKNGVFCYIDRESKMKLEFSDINVDISGKMYGNSTELETSGKIENVGFKYGEIDYIANTSLETKTVLKIDYEQMIFEILESELLINNLAMDISGDIQLPSDSMFFNLDLKTKASDFKNFLSMVPTEYSNDLADIQANGQASISGKIKGYYFEDNYPGFSIGLDIREGDFQYVGLPEKIKNIRADAKLSKSQGDLNLTVLSIKEAHAEIKNNPVDLSLTMNNLMEDAWFDGAFVGKINFDHLKDVLPLDSVNLSGEVDANLFVEGNYSAVENEEYNKLKSDGIVLLNNFVYDSPSLTKKIFVPTGQLKFTPERVNLDAFKMRVGSSDFNLTGNVSNYINYVLNAGVLKGNLQLNSNMMNLNELLLMQKNTDETRAQSTEKSAESGEQISENKDEILAFSIPENLDISFKSNIKNAVFDRLPISNIKGLITANKGTLRLKGLKMNMLDGELNLSGSYKNTTQNQPLIDFGIDMKEFDIPLAYKSLSGMRHLLPVAGRSQGKLSTAVTLKGQLTANHKFIPSSIDGQGTFGTKGLEIIDSPIFSQLKGIINTNKFRNVKVDDFVAHFSIDDGNMDLRPFKTKVLGHETTILGTLSAENLINMRMDFNIPRDAFGPDIQNILAILPGNEKIKTVPAGVVITGPVGEPEVRMDLTQTRKTISEASKGELQNSINKLGNSLKKLFEK